MFGVLEVLILGFCDRRRGGGTKGAKLFFVFDWTK
jgi:hypothetical protein